MNDLNTTLLGGGLIAMIAAAWTKVRGLLNQLAAIAVLSIRLQPGLQIPIGLYIKAHFKPLYGGMFMIDSQRFRLESLGADVLAPYTLPQGSSLMWRRRGRGIQVIWVENGFGEIKFLRPTDFEAFIAEALRWERELQAQVGKGSNFGVTVLQGSADDDWSAIKSGGKRGARSSSNTVDQDRNDPVPNSMVSLNSFSPHTDDSFLYSRSSMQPKKSALQHLFYEQDVLDLIEEAKQWLGRRDWYRERGIPWRRGTLAWGGPGCGKSSFAYALAQTLGIPLVVIRLGTMTDRELQDAVSLSTGSPRVILFEDFDTVWHGRENQTVHKRLTFDCMLNVLSGVNSVDGYYLVITTNDVSKLDSAIAAVTTEQEAGSLVGTRPGRIDRTLYFGPSTERCRRQILEHTLHGLDANIDQLVKQSDGYSAAQTQELAVTTAFHALAATKAKAQPEEQLDEPGFEARPKSARKARPALHRVQ